MENFSILIMLGTLFFLFIIFVFMIILIPIIYNHIENNKELNIYDIKTNNDLFSKILYNISKKEIEKNYQIENKNIKTQKGNYRVDYIKKVESEYETLYNICFYQNIISQDLLNYIATYPKITKNTLYIIVSKYICNIKEMQKQSFDDFLNTNYYITPNDFFKLKNHQKGDLVGVYIIYNQNKNMYYVGQAKRLFFRINQHFTGNGNGDVYADYKYGDNFYIKIISLTNSGYQDLDKLEKDLIEKYDAFKNGYNKTKGNK